MLSSQGKAHVEGELEGFVKVVVSSEVPGDRRTAAALALGPVMDDTIRAVFESLGERPGLPPSLRENMVWAARQTYRPTVSRAPPSVEPGRAADAVERLQQTGDAKAPSGETGAGLGALAWWFTLPDGMSWVVTAWLAAISLTLLLPLMVERTAPEDPMAPFSPQLAPRRVALDHAAYTSRPWQGGVEVRRKRVLTHRLTGQEFLFKPSPDLPPIPDPYQPTPL